MAKLDLEVEISRLRSENIEALKKIDSTHMMNLDLMVDMEEMRKHLDQDINEIAKLQKDLKQALQERISLQEKLNEVSHFFSFFSFLFFF